MYGLQGWMVARPGQRNAISISEVWGDRESHEASLARGWTEAGDRGTERRPGLVAPKVPKSTANGGHATATSARLTLEIEI